MNIKSISPCVHRAESISSRPDMYLYVYILYIYIPNVFNNEPNNIPFGLENSKCNLIPVDLIKNQKRFSCVWVNRKL